MSSSSPPSSTSSSLSSSSPPPPPPSSSLPLAWDLATRATSQECQQTQEWVACGSVGPRQQNNHCCCCFRFLMSLRLQRISTVQQLQGWVVWWCDFRNSRTCRGGQCERSTNLPTPTNSEGGSGSAKVAMRSGGRGGGGVGVFQVTVSFAEFGFWRLNVL